LLAAEFVFGSQVALSGIFVASSDPLPAADFLDSLCDSLSGTPVRPTSHNSTMAALLPENLPDGVLSFLLIYVRWDAAKPSLGPAYDDPCRILQRSLTHFHLVVGNRVKMVLWKEATAAMTALVYFYT
jgi:hypothetical protein